MTERVSIPLAGPLARRGSFPGHLARPAAAPDAAPDVGLRPGVIVLHEIFGVNNDIKRITDRFAAEGYVALAPQLYAHGNKALCLTRVLASGFSGDAERRTLDDIEAARQHLAAQPDVDPDRIAVAGFCLGGGFALLFAAQANQDKHRVQAANVNYGVVPKEKDKLRAVCPVVASYGSNDRDFVEPARRLERHLEELGIPHDVKIYDGAGHSFMNKDNAPAWMLRLNTRMHAGYREVDAEDSWRRILAFFAEHMGG